ncbi:MAG: hypothetical protein D6677_08370 [Calditrichaeota bacterium]|nr:MAG: hypothetical protein D6677_08370 [Calditrichota bacterium]
MKLKIRLYRPLWLLLILASLAGAQTYTPDNRLDINNATLEEIEQLPVSKEVSRNIYNYLTYRGDLRNVYDLKRIEGVDQQLFLKIRDLIRVEPFRMRSTTQQRIEQMYFRLDRWSGNEGVSDALIDLWIENALDPININDTRYDALINLQNVSPVDAVAILNYRHDNGRIRNMRDLRGVPGLSYYGYANARNFVDYEAPAEDGPAWHGHVTVRVDNTPLFADESDVSTEVNLLNSNGGLVSQANTYPNQFVKGRFSWHRHYKFGFSYNHYLGEPVFYYDSGKMLPKMKWFAGLENMQWDMGGTPLELRKLYVGNYSVTFGQGVVMENTDFFTPRKSGFGFRKRFKGLAGDNSRTRQFALRGVAAELAYGNLSAIGFASLAPRDAILNRAAVDSAGHRAFNQLIVLDQRFPYAGDDAGRLPDQTNLSWLDAVNELTLGGHLQYDFWPGTWLGVTWYESAYDRYLEPNPEEIVAGNNWERRQVTTDSEIKQAYGGPVSRGSSPLWSEARSFRRVYGVDFQSVIGNLALMGEYGELDKGGSLFKPGDDPKALTLSAYLQYPSFNLLALYRHYDVAYDNPYQRSFSNYRRFKGTIYEDYYYLQSALYGQLYTNAVQPQSEEGFYLNSYYQISRQWTTRFEYDQWTRLADQAAQYRLVGWLNYRPIFPLQFQFRQKWQARDAQNNISLRYFKSLEFRGRMRARLSNFSSMDLIYINSKTLVHPRPRVFGDIVLDSEGYGAGFTHNVNTNLKLSGFFLFYKGFIWNFEDTQFIVTDSNRGAMRAWLSMYSRLSSYFSLRLKYTLDIQAPAQNINFNPNSPEIGRLYNADYARSNNNTVYLEMNYTF